MQNEQILQQVIGEVLDRFAKQTANYEAEIANLNAQILVMKMQNDELIATLNMPGDQSV